jgi:hypothetical protein
MRDHLLSLAIPIRMVSSLSQRMSLCEKAAEGNKPGRNSASGCRGRLDLSDGDKVLVKKLWKLAHMLGQNTHVQVHAQLFEGLLA